ncbi:IucA/IucC family siderophore biosynthesis protein, partial [Dietzia sp. SLG510A3-30A2]|nr:IucA/IucC family siderophore biosynthesis protein [Dietzia sp. SLG510A3-30A2]
PRFKHSCLNRLQLRNTRQMVDLTDQAASLQFAGTLANPLVSRLVRDDDTPGEPQRPPRPGAEPGAEPATVASTA